MSKDVNVGENNGTLNVFNGDHNPRLTVIGKLVEILASSDKSDDINLERVPAEIEYKIQFNHLKEYTWLVDEYITSSLLVNESISELNRIILNGSVKLKRQMKRFYFDALTKHSISTSPFDLERLRDYSDEVVKSVIIMTKSFVEDSLNARDGFYKEDIEDGISLITSYAIIECIVLENPNDHD